MELMKGLGEIARKHDLPIQTHVSESKPDTDWVPSLHASHAHVFDIPSI